MKENGKFFDNMTVVNLKYFTFESTHEQIRSQESMTWAALMSCQNIEQYTTGIGPSTHNVCAEHDIRN